jgi:hypothetical protein
MLPLTELIPIGAIGFAAIAGGIGLFEAILDLRAKVRARDVLSRKATSDPALQQLINQIGEQPTPSSARFPTRAGTGTPSKLALEMASKTISNALIGELPDSDQKRVEEGLHQTSKAGESRYINMLLF